MKQEDLVRYTAFKKVIEQGDFKIEWKAIIAVASLFQWYNGLDAEIKKVIANPPPVFKFVGDPVPIPKEKKTRKPRKPRVDK